MLAKRAAEEKLAVAQKAKDELEHWKVVHADNFGKTDPDQKKATEMYRLADQAFFKLLAANEVEIIASAILANPSAFMRAGRIKTLFTGYSVEHTPKVGVSYTKVERTYHSLSAELALKVGEAIGKVIFARWVELSRDHPMVGDNFWVMSPKLDGYHAKTAKVAGQIAGLMHAMLNIAEFTNNREDFNDLAKLFKRTFNRLPKNIYDRVETHLDNGPQSPQSPKSQTVDRLGAGRERKVGGKNVHPANNGTPIIPLQSFAEKMEKVRAVFIH